MRLFRLALAAALITLMLPGIASANHANAIAIFQDCSKTWTTVDYVNFGNNHRLVVSIVYDGSAPDVTTLKPTGTGTTAPIYGPFSNVATVTVKTPNDNNQPLVSTAHNESNCPTPTPEQPTATPEQPTATPEQPTATPEQPTATPCEDCTPATQGVPTPTLPNCELVELGQAIGTPCSTVTPPDNVTIPPTSTSSEVRTGQYDAVVVVVVLLAALMFGGVLIFRRLRP